MYAAGYQPCFKAGTLQLRSQVRKSLESLILTATSGATFSVLFVCALLLKIDPLRFNLEGMLIAVMIIWLFVLIRWY